MRKPIINAGDGTGEHPTQVSTNMSVAECYGLLQRIAECYGLLQCVAVCCIATYMQTDRNTNR